MSLEKTENKTPEPVVCVVPAATVTSMSTAGRRASRKCVAVAVTCAVVVTMVVVGVLVGIKLVTDANLERHRIHRKLKSGDALVDEEYYQDRDSGKWLRKYHVTEPDRETWALNEFDKGVQVLKLRLKSGEFVCIVIRQPVVNGSAVAAEVRPSATDGDDDTEVINEAGNVTSVRYNIAIMDGDLSATLGAAGREFCADLNVYAAYLAPQQADTSVGNEGRQRRQAYTYWRCFISWIACRIITYLDSPAYNYFACLPTCNRVTVFL